MRVSKTLKIIMIDKDVSVEKLAEMTGKKKSTVYNTFRNDSLSKGGGMTFENVVSILDALGCDVIIKDRETGKIY